MLKGAALMEQGRQRDKELNESIDFLIKSNYGPGVENYPKLILKYLKRI